VSLNILSVVVWVLFVRIFFCSLVIILIALQSVNAIAVINVSHQDSHQKSALESLAYSHQDSDHHNDDELLAFQTESLNGENDHSDADHPDCHANHCHHSNLVYLDLLHAMVLSAQVKNQLQPYHVIFSSEIESPDFRPPIA
jgi:hypothetical protein